MTIVERIIKLKEEHPGPFFMGTPDEWYEPCHWWCENGHRRGSYLKSEYYRDNVCFACHEPVHLGPREIPGVEPK